MGSRSQQGQRRTTERWLGAPEGQWCLQEAGGSQVGGCPQGRLAALGRQEPAREPLQRPDGTKSSTDAGSREMGRRGDLGTGVNECLQFRPERKPRPRMGSWSVHVMASLWRQNDLKARRRPGGAGPAPEAAVTGSQGSPAKPAPRPPGPELRSRPCPPAPSIFQETGPWCRKGWVCCCKESMALDHASDGLLRAREATYTTATITKRRTDTEGNRSSCLSLGGRKIPGRFQTV